MRLPISRNVVLVGTTGSFYRQTVRIEQHILQYLPEYIVPNFAFRGSEIQNRRRRLRRSVLFISNPGIQEGHSAKNPLPRAGPCIGQGPDVTKAIIFRIAIAERVPQYGHQRYPVRRAGRSDSVRRGFESVEARVDSYQFGATCNRDPLQTKELFVVARLVLSGDIVVFSKRTGERRDGLVVRRGVTILSKRSLRNREQQYR